MRRTSLFFFATASVIFLLSALYITYPLILHLGDRTTGLGDELLIAWIHNWVIHTVISGNIIHIFQANIFYPYLNSLAYSDFFFTSSIIALLPTVLVGQPIVANNIILIVSFFLLGLSLWILTYKITRNYVVSLCSGFLVQFSPAIIDKKIHLQILFVFFIPLSIYFLITYIKTPQKKYLWLCLVCFILQTYNSFLPGYFLVLFYAVFFFHILFFNKKLLSLFFNRSTLIALVIVTLILIPIIIPYFQVSQKFRYVRDIRESIHLALQPEDLLVTHEYSRLEQFLRIFENPARYSYPIEVKPGFLGGILTILSCCALVYGFLRYKQKDIILNSFFVSSVCSLLLSFGPALHLHRLTIHKPFPIILPYTLAYYIVPGFQGLRNSSRWEVAFILFIIPVISFMLVSFTQNLFPKLRIFLFTLIILLTLIEFKFPINYVPIPQTSQFPKAHTWFAHSPPNSSYIEFPLYNWNMFPYATNELLRDYYTTIHFRKTLNGASGFSPPPWQKEVEYLAQSFPSKDSIAVIKNMHITYIVVDNKEYDMLHQKKFKFGNTHALSGDAVVNELKEIEYVKLVTKTDSSYIFSITY